MQARRWMGLCGAVLGALAAALAGCARKAGAPGPASRSERRAVGVIRVALGEVAQRLELTGDVRPFATVLLASKVPGRLERLGFENEQGEFVPLAEGARVRRGQVVALVDRDVYAARRDQARAALAMAEAQCEDAVREAERAEALFREGSATQQMLDKARTARKAAEAALAQAEAAWKLAQIEFEESSPRAPVDAVVTRKHVDEGNLVSVGAPLATLEQLAPVKIVLSVPEKYLAAIQPGQTRVRVASESAGEGGVDAVVSKVYPAVDPATRTGTVEVELENADGRWRSGAFVRAELEVARAQQTVVIPLSAISWVGAQSYVFVVEEGRARRRAVRVGLREQERCQVVEGLQPGETLVVEGWRDLREGDEVVAREVSPS